MCCNRTIVIVTAIVCFTGLVLAWSVMGYQQAQYHAAHPTKDPVSDEGKALKACLNKNGVPILDTNTQVMIHCEGI